MAQSYTPGLKVVGATKLHKQRILPIKGEVLVEQGKMVEASDVVARTQLPGDVVPLNVVNQLGIGPKSVAAAMLKQVGEPVTEGEVIARSSSFFGIFNSEITSPRDGTIENISSITGQVILRGLPMPVQIKAYVPGLVSEVIPEEGVIIDCVAGFIQGIFGIGGESTGRLVILVDDADGILDEGRIKDEHRGCILVGGSQATAGALRKAEQIGAAGIVVGGFDDRDLRDFLGYDLGVAITGSEDIGITLIVTEGFGRIRMADKTFTLLQSNNGRQVSINGSTQIRAGVIRPEVVIPIDDEFLDANDSLNSEGGGLEAGACIRCIRAPYFGKIGIVKSLPHELYELESETKVRILEVEFKNGERAMVPRANIEIIEGD